MRLRLSTVSSVICFFSMFLGTGSVFAEFNNQTLAPEVFTSGGIVLNLSADLRVPPSVSMSLSELADLGALPLEIVSKVMNQEINLETLVSKKSGMVPGREFAKVVKDSLRGTLNAKDFSQLRLLVTDEVKVHQITRKELSALRLRNQLTTHFRQACESCEFVLGDLRLPILADQDEILEYHLEPRDNNVSGSFLVPLRIETSRGRQQAWLSGSLSIWKQGWVAGRWLRRGESLTAKDLQPQKINVTFAKDSLAPVDQILGQVVARDVRNGQALFNSDLLRPNKITRGQVVKARMIESSIEIHILAEALESAAVGQRLRLKLVDSKKVLTGFAEESGQVRLE